MRVGLKYSFHVQDQLRNVRQVQATKFAFAALLADGSVVTWGDPRYGGDSSKVQSRLQGVEQVEATHMAFAAILRDGSVVTWGFPLGGSDTSDVRDELRNVKQVRGTSSAFAAILQDGSVVTWGFPRFGGKGDSSKVQDQVTSSRVWVKFIQLIVHSLLSWQTDLLSHGVILYLVVTVLRSKVSSGVCGRYRARWPRLLQSWQTDLLLRGVIHWMVRTALRSKISSRMFSRCMAHMLHLLRFWQTDLLWHGAMQRMVGTALRSKMSTGICRVCSTKFGCHCHGQLEGIVSSIRIKSLPAGWGKKAAIKQPAEIHSNRYILVLLVVSSGVRDDDPNFTFSIFISTVIVGGWACLALGLAKWETQGPLSWLRRQWHGPSKNFGLSSLIPSGNLTLAIENHHFLWENSL